jgi:alkylhydroperoxidase family enzyme
MARVPYVDQPVGELVGLYADIAGLRGSVLNLHRVLANQPAALRAFMVMSRQVRDDAVLPARLRELAVLATAYALDVPYEQFHHVPIARRLGISDAQLAALEKGADLNLFDPLERAVIAYADQVARTHDVDDAVFQALRARLSTAEILDLALTVGWYHLCAALLGPLRIETEDVRDPAGQSGAHDP